MDVTTISCNAKKFQKSVDKRGIRCYNNTCRQASDTNAERTTTTGAEKPTGTILENDTEKVILYKKDDTGAPEGATIVSTVRFLMSETL